MAAPSLASGVSSARTMRAFFPGCALLLEGTRKRCGSDLAPVIARLGIAKGDEVLEVGTLDPGFRKRVVERVGSLGAVDRLSLLPNGDSVLPFIDCAFDAVVCSGELAGFRDAVGLVEEVARVVRPGGTIAVVAFETQVSVKCPWPKEVERALAPVLEQHTAGASDDLQRLSAIAVAARGAGLIQEPLEFVSIEERAPLSAELRAAARAHLSSLAALVGKCLGPEEWALLWPFFSGDAIEKFLDHPRTQVQRVAAVLHAKRPGDDERVSSEQPVTVRGSDLRR